MLFLHAAVQSVRVCFIPVCGCVGGEGEGEGWGWVGKGAGELEDLLSLVYIMLSAVDRRLRVT